MTADGGPRLSDHDEEGDGPRIADGTRTERPDGPASITVYSRPGCPFSSSLMRGLDGSDLPYDIRDIWEDEDAAAFVRSVTGGDETVPTVAVGDVALVNPTTREVLAVVAEEAPTLLPEGYEPPEPGFLDRALTRLLGG